MVYLNRIYTRSGDQGETSLGDGSRVPKTDLRIRAFGSADELNSHLGVALAAGLPQPYETWIAHIQNDLFDLGGDLCVPETDEPLEFEPLRMTPAQVTQLERWIDEANEPLEPLKSFILPGGSLAAAHLHVARTVCRRAEQEILELAARDSINPQVPIYINRLSDLLFVLARCCNNQGQSDVLWIPGKHREIAATDESV